LTAFFSVASADMTLKMVVPTLGRRLTSAGVNGSLARAPLLAVDASVAIFVIKKGLDALI
jgi:hypothetical protein